MALDKRFPQHRPNPAARLQLICFPYAGGSSAIYREWQPLLPEIEIIAFEPAGRGSRFIEAPAKTVEALASEAHHGLRQWIDRPFAIFGHSLGAIVGWRVARMLASDGRTPVHFVASGAGAPHTRSKRPQLHALPERELVEELRKLNGTPREVLENKELLSLVLPYVRADFEASERFEYIHDEGGILGCDVTMLAGSRDEEVPDEDARAWADYTRGAFAMHTIEGDHFFVHTHRDGVLRHVRETLRGRR